jgi:transposase InsO family protein
MAHQLWVADITYIRLHKEWVYLAVILDAFSRKVVGWELERNLTARLPIADLETQVCLRRFVSTEGFTLALCAMSVPTRAASLHFRLPRRNSASTFWTAVSCMCGST